MVFKKGQKPWNKGKKLSKKHIENLRIAHKGYKMPEKQKDKISKALIGNKNPFYGRKHSKETKLLIGIKSKGRIAWNKGNITIYKKECLRCGNIFKTKVKKQKYCSIICANYIDGRSYFVSPGRYGLNWNEIRLRVLERDLFKCKYCGKTNHERRLDVHHKIPFLISFDNSLNNLITLCRNCHKEEEEKIKKIYYGRNTKKT